MKKIIPVFSFLILAYFTSHSQSYFPMMDSVNRWYYMNNIMGVVSENPFKTAIACYCQGKRYTQCYTANDTTINGQNYYELLLKPDIYQPCLSGYLREDTPSKKIFFLHPDSSNEELIYDFSMQVGDTIFLKFIYSGYFNTGYYVLDSVNYITITAGIRKVFFLNCRQGTNKTLMWIESVGHPGHVAYTYCYNTYGTGWFVHCPIGAYNYNQILTCFEHTDKVYFDSCAQKSAQNSGCIGYIDSCTYGNICGSIDEQFLFGAVTINPNPARNETAVVLEIREAGGFSLMLYDVTGKILLKNYNLGNLPQGKTTKQINLTDFPAGAYILQCRNTEGKSIFRKLIVQ